MVFVILAKRITHSEIWACLAGFSSFLGHLYPVYIRFKGGKGVATFIGVFLTLSPYALLVDLGIFILIVYLSRYISLGSIVSAAVLPAVLLALAYPKVYVIISIVMGALIFLRHRENIQRLREGRENKIGKENT
jgi:glycerol-3-phosphate acyltransferase PlsY